MRDKIEKDINRKLERILSKYDIDKNQKTIPVEIVQDL